MSKPRREDARWRGGERGRYWWIVIRGRLSISKKFVMTLIFLPNLPK
jgi:hypothetical protein